VPVVRLTEVFRQAAIAHHHQRAPDSTRADARMRGAEPSSDFQFRRADDPERIAATLVKLCRRGFQNGFVSTRSSDVRFFVR